LSHKVVAANPRSGSKIDNLALNIIKKFQPNALWNDIFDVIKFFDCELEDFTQVVPDYRKLPAGIHGYTDADTMESVISIDLIDDQLQRPFCLSTIAHEIGHCIIHVPEFRIKKSLLKWTNGPSNNTLRMYRESEIPLYKNPEWQAWRFAGALLMPAPSILKVINSGYTEDDISKKFRVSVSFVKARMRALKLKTS